MSKDQKIARRSREKRAKNPDDVDTLEGPSFTGGSSAVLLLSDKH
jgi:hypothetical protein